MVVVLNEILQNCSKVDCFAAKMTYSLGSTDSEDSKSWVECSKFTTASCYLGPLNLLAISKSSFHVFEESDFCSLTVQAIGQYFELHEDYFPLIASLGRHNFKNFRLRGAKTASSK